jgi:hypothetical protein
MPCHLIRPWTSTTGPRFAILHERGGTPNVYAGAATTLSLIHSQRRAKVGRPLLFAIDPNEASDHHYNPDTSVNTELRMLACI